MWAPGLSGSSLRQPTPLASYGVKLKELVPASSQGPLTYPAAPGQIQARPSFSLSSRGCCLWAPLGLSSSSHFSCPLFASQEALG